MYKKTNSFLLCMDLQSYSHDCFLDKQEIVSKMRNPQPYSHFCFSKISRTLFDFLNNTYWVSFFQRNSLPIFWTGVFCFSVALFYSTLFCCGGKANLVQFTLFYSTLLTLTDRQTDRQTDREMNTLASRGLEEPFFISSCAVVSVFGSGGKQVLVLHSTYVLRSTMKTATP